MDTAAASIPTIVTSDQRLKIASFEANWPSSNFRMANGDVTARVTFCVRRGEAL